MFDGVTKKLIIVGEEKTDVYCEYLSMLISCNDDIKNDANETVEHIGAIDGSVDTAIWTDKIYLDNRCHTSSRQKVLFIGEPKSAKNIAPNIVCLDDNEYGIKMGWLGNKAVINVDVDVFKKDKSKKLYKKFYDEYVDMVKEYNCKLFNIEDEEKAKFTQDRIGDNIDKVVHVANDIFKKKDKDEEKEDKHVEVNHNVAKGIVVGIGAAAAFVPMILAPLPAAYVIYDVKDNKNNYDKVKEQQYRYAVLKFYLNYFNAFMGI